MADAINKPMFAKSEGRSSWEAIAFATNEHTYQKVYE
jgi:hypothetical protein